MTVPALRGLVRSVHRWPWLGALALLAPDLVWAESVGTAALKSRAPVRVYAHRFDPREHPDYDRHHARAPSWDLFGQRTRFTVLRGFEVQDDQVVNFRAEIDKFTQRHQLGEVIWPSYPVLFATNLHELAAEIRQRDLFLFDIWGYVPGSGPGGYWQQFQVPPAVFRQLEQDLGERWLGMDIGEQDGRYIGGYAPQMHPISHNRLEQYLHFHRHFDAMSEALGDRLCTLVSLNFGHYLVREGTYTLIGAETAQALPNSQVYYAFIRGAGKQYGVPWFGNASIFNRWGYKAYGSTGKSEGYEFGPTKGTSLSLLKRLLYSHILYNAMVVGFENAWFDGDQLSPIGRIQQSARAWVGQHETPGALQTPVALLLDFYSGWSFPRHLYSSRIYRVWGNLPYEPGDHLTDGLLGLLYPGYQDASFFHDESGFLSATPYGDVADCLLSDAPLWLLKRYPVVIVAGALSPRWETRDKLEAYVAQGGHLVITAANLAQWRGGVAGLRAGAPRTVRSPEASGGPVQVDVAGQVVSESAPFDVRLLEGSDLRPLSSCQGQVLAVERRHGAGKVTALASLFGLPAAAGLSQPPVSEVDRPLPSPYPLLNHVRLVLDAVLREPRLFAVDDRLGLVTCRKRPGEYTLGVFNNTWAELPLEVTSLCGPIESVEELTLDTTERGAAGFLPEKVEPAALGQNRERTIAGGDVRVFAVKVREDRVTEIAHEAPPTRPRGRILPLRRTRSIQEAILSRPTFHQHFDGVLVEASYLQERERSALERERRWLGLQQVRVIVDMTSTLNLYPDLRLLDNLRDEYRRSVGVIEAVLEKMPALGARDLVLSLHRHPENNFTDAQATASFEQTLRRIGDTARPHGITLHLRLAQGKPPWNLGAGLAWMQRVKADNFKLAPSTALLGGDIPAELEAGLREAVGLWLVSRAERDLTGTVWTAHAVPSTEDVPAIARLLRRAPAAALVLDSVFADQDAEYTAARLLEPVPGERP
jgi:hypothetical protein